MKQDKKLVNIESTKNAIESEKEMSATDVLKGFMANHAKEHYLEAMKIAGVNIDADMLESILSETATSENGVHYVYTSPKFDDKMSKEDWEKINKGAIYVEKIVKTEWYKKAVSIEDATTINRIVNAYNRYNDAKQGAKDRIEKQLANTAAILGVSVEALKALQKK